ncbi:class A beta-lactamase-related serine hydrolase [Funiculus sociatus GB2-A5]|uniref:Class A beta-lactamase-related serine hydrolase n=1 Tax=Funiculus sociatus GB2-A5 TaxID=2933946 RepID=A0ABV0JKL7_9CYAN
MTQQPANQSVVPEVSVGSKYTGKGQTPDKVRAAIRERRRRKEKSQIASPTQREASSSPVSRRTPLVRVEDKRQHGIGSEELRADLGQKAALGTERRKSYLSARSQSSTDLTRGGQQARRRSGRVRQRANANQSIFAASSEPRNNVTRLKKPSASLPVNLPVNKSTRRTRPQRPVSPLLYAARLLILGVGVGAIAGTLLSAWDPAKRQLTGAINPEVAIAQNSAVGGEAVASRQPNTQNLPPTALAVGEEIPTLKAKVQALVTQNPKFQPGVFLVDLETNAYLDLSGSEVFAAASTIKVPILVAFFQDVDAGKIRLDEKLTLEQNAIAGGSGELQYKKPGTQYTALEVATKMIIISDNTATNMLIQRLGGAQALNQRFQSWGLTATVIHNLLPDLEGTNTTTPKDLANLMAMVNQGNLMSLPSRDRLLDIMQRTVTNSLLPKGLGKGATIAHKTGDIGSLLADVGLIDLPSGKRYIAAVMVKRPHNDYKASELIRQISRTAYQYFSEPPSVPDATEVSPIPKPVTAGNNTSFIN